jgi:hypothetical protein
MGMGHKNGIPAKRVLALALVLLITVFPLSGSCVSNGTDSDIPAFSGPLPESRVIKLSIESVHMGIKVPFMVYLPKGYHGGGKHIPYGTGCTVMPLPKTCG